MSELPRLVVILGPTASGKSALGIRLAEQLGGEILVCDSTQVYRHFDIGTAKVPLAERRGILHHLIDLVEPDEVFTAGDYRKPGGRGAGRPAQRGARRPILTAGTGLYLRALLGGPGGCAHAVGGTARPPARAQPSGMAPTICTACSRASIAKPLARIAPRDTQKIIRAIEIRVLAGKGVADVHRDGPNRLGGLRHSQDWTLARSCRALLENRRSRYVDDRSRLA